VIVYGLGEMIFIILSKKTLNEKRTPKMSSPYNFFEETNLPPQGIDRISIEIDDCLIADKSAFRYRGNISKSICLRKKNHNGFGVAYSLELHAESINPFFDILDQIICHFVDLTISGVLRNYHNYPPDMIYSFYYNNLNRGFYLSCIEFYFDFMLGDMYLSPKTEKQLYETTRYSPDYPGERKSILKAYLRPERLRAKNHHAFSSIDSMTFTNRIEFSLKNRNCRYLALENLYGDYDMIFNRYLPFLASRWRQYGDCVACIPNLYNLHYAANFKQIEEMSRFSAIPRFHLVRTPQRINLHRPYKRNETDMAWGIKFFTGYDTYNTEEVKESVYRNKYMKNH
jgi:hypothetical protein